MFLLADADGCSDQIPANHILAASVMSAPAALAIAKLMCPDEKGATTNTEKDAYQVEIE